jgi:hypothetical protein
MATLLDNLLNINFRACDIYRNVHDKMKMNAVFNAISTQGLRVSTWNIQMISSVWPSINIQNTKMSSLQDRLVCPVLLWMSVFHFILIVVVFICTLHVLVCTYW